MDSSSQEENERLRKLVCYGDRCQTKECVKWTGADFLLAALAEVPPCQSPFFNKDQAAYEQSLRVYIQALEVFETQS